MLPKQRREGAALPSHQAGRRPLIYPFTSLFHYFALLLMGNYTFPPRDTSKGESFWNILICNTTPHGDPSSTWARASACISALPCSDEPLGAGVVQFSSPALMANMNQSPEAAVLVNQDASRITEPQKSPVFCTMYIIIHSLWYPPWVRFCVPYELII